jgi:hypothetical protein
VGQRAGIHPEQCGLGSPYDVAMHIPGGALRNRRRTLSASFGRLCPVVVAAGLLAVSAATATADNKTQFIALASAQRALSADGFYILPAERPHQASVVGMFEASPSIDPLGGLLTVIVYGSTQRAVDDHLGCGLRVENVAAFVFLRMTVRDRQTALRALRSLGAPLHPDRFVRCKANAGPPVVVLTPKSH